jgi:hypothetical protein
MKIETELDLRPSIKRAFRLSNRAADYVAHRLAITKKINITHAVVSVRNAKKHADDHGGAGNSAAATALATLEEYSEAQLVAWVDLVGEVVAAEKEMDLAQSKVNSAKLRMAEWAANGRPTAEQALAQKMAAAKEWWEREGKYEDAMELRGESKLFYYENDRRADIGEPPISAAEFMKK